LAEGVSGSPSPGLPYKPGEGKSETGMETGLLKNSFVKYQYFIIFPQHILSTL
jgi:hypothetical protein